MPLPSEAAAQLQAPPRTPLSNITPAKAATTTPALPTKRLRQSKGAGDAYTTPAAKRKLARDQIAELTQKRNAIMRIYLGRSTASEAAKTCGNKWSPDTLRILAQGLPLGLREDDQFAQVTRAASLAVSLPARGEFTVFELQQALLRVERDHKPQAEAVSEYGVSERCLRNYLTKLRMMHPMWDAKSRKPLSWEVATLEQIVSTVSKGHTGPKHVFSDTECALFVSAHAQLAEYGAGMTLKQQSARYVENARSMADDLEKENANPNIIARLRYTFHARCALYITVCIYSSWCLTFARLFDCQFVCVSWQGVMCGWGV